MSTDVQDFKVEVNGTIVTVTCVLAPGSQARGCAVHLLSTTANITEEIERPDNETLTFSGHLSIIEGERFEVRVFDYEEDGSIGSLYWSTVVPAHISPSSITVGKFYVSYYTIVLIVLHE